MANHKSAQKQARSSAAKRLRNRYQHKTVRTYLKRLRTSHDKKAATEMLPVLNAMLDKLAKKNVIHKNKASNLKSSIQLHVNKMA
jgi:small subunit ribosomal protein S20